MSKRLRVFLLVTTVLVVALGVPARARVKAAPTVTKPKLSAVPVAGVPFTASGVARPTATAMSRTVVKVGLYAFADGRWVVQDVSRAKLVAGASGTQYSRKLVVAAEGKYGVRAFHYRSGKLVAKSALAAFDVARRITVDSNVNGWMAPRLGETQAPPGTPLDIVFTTPADWAAPLVDGKPLNGAARFIWGEFEQVDTNGLIWHTDGLAPGRYDWMRDGMPKYGTGCLVVAQQIDIDKMSHEDTHALPYLPADISFGEVSSAGMGCDRSIAFVTRIFSQTSANPLEWHTDGLVPGSYDWKCWMDDCHYGKLVVDDAADVAVDSDPHEVVTNVAAGTPFDFVFTGARMMCWRTIHFTTAGSDLTKTTSFTPTDQKLTWHTDGLAAGSYEWECWMGPQCHHGTVVVE
jgi:hypothetical protein